MGISNETKECIATGKNNPCFPAGYAPDILTVRVSGLVLSSPFYSGPELPREFEASLYWYDEVSYFGTVPGNAYFMHWEGSNVEFFWGYYPDYFYWHGFSGGIECPRYFQSSDEEDYVFWGGVVEIVQNWACYLGEKPSSTGDLINIPHDADILSQVVPYDTDKVKTRYSRHRDGTNIKIYQE